METLPTEMILELCKYLDFYSLLNLSKTCQTLSSIITSDQVFAEESNTLHLDNFVFSTIPNDPLLRARYFLRFKEIPSKTVMTYRFLKKRILEEEFDTLYIGKYHHFRTDFGDILELLQQKKSIKKVYIGRIPARCCLDCFCFIINWMLTDDTGIKFHLAPDFEYFYSQKLDWKVVEYLHLNVTFNKSLGIKEFFDEERLTRKELRRINKFDSIKTQGLERYATLNLELNDFKEFIPNLKKYDNEFRSFKFLRETLANIDVHKEYIQKILLSDFKFLRKLKNLKNLSIEISEEKCFFGHEQVDFLSHVKSLKIIGNFEVHQPCINCIGALVQSLHKNASYNVVNRSKNLKRRRG